MQIAVFLFILLGTIFLPLLKLSSLANSAQAERIKLNTRLVLLQSLLFSHSMANLHPIVLSPGGFCNSLQAGNYISKMRNTNFSGQVFASYLQ